MPISEFLQTQDHPLITAVLQRVYGLDKETLGLDAQPADAPPLPRAEMRPGSVQWPERQPYPTYFASAGEPPAA